MYGKPAKLMDIRRLFVQDVSVVDEASLQALRVEYDKEKYMHGIVGMVKCGEL